MTPRWQVAPQVFNHLMQQLPALVSAMHAHLQPWVPQLVQVVLLHWHGALLLQVPHGTLPASYRLPPLIWATPSLIWSTPSYGTLRCSC